MNPSDQQNIIYTFIKIVKQRLSNLPIEITWILFGTSVLETKVKMVYVFRIVFKIWKFSIKTTLINNQTLFCIASFLKKTRNLGCVCFLETTFQTFLCLFAIRKVGQRKTLSGQRKTLSSQREIWLGFHESVFLLFWAENTFWKLWKI